MKVIKGMQIYVHHFYSVYCFVAKYPDGSVVTSSFEVGNATTADAIKWWRNRSKT
jgi:hypothetical protein